jgi:hypothetical protein
MSGGDCPATHSLWDNHPKHGPQFKAEVCEQTLPATIAGIKGYIGSGLIKSIDPKLAERIVGQFKEAWDLDTTSCQVCFGSTFSPQLQILTSQLHKDLPHAAHIVYTGISFNLLHHIPHPVLLKRYMIRQKPE